MSNERSGDVSIINPESFTVEMTIPAERRPRGIHSSPDGKLLYVALSGSPPAGPRYSGKTNSNPFSEEVKVDRNADGIGIIDLSRKVLVRKIEVGPDPEEFALSSDGKRLYVANEDAGTLSVVNIEQNTIERTIPVGDEPEGVTLRPDNKALFVTCEQRGEVFAVDTVTFHVLGQFTVSGRPRSVVFTRGGEEAWIASEESGLVHVVDAPSLKPVQSIRLPEGARPMGTAASPDGKRIYVSTGWLGAVCSVDAETRKVRASMKVGSRPWGIALSPDGRKLFVANGPSNDISVLDLEEEKEEARVKTGASPWGVAVIRTGPR